MVSSTTFHLGTLRFSYCKVFNKLVSLSPLSNISFMISRIMNHDTLLLKAHNAFVFHEKNQSVKSLECKKCSAEEMVRGVTELSMG